MQLPEFARSTTLRWTVLVAAIFAAIIVAMLGFVYLKAKHDLTMRSDRMIASQMGVFAQLSPERRLDAIDEQLGRPSSTPAGVEPGGLARQVVALGEVGCLLGRLGVQPCRRRQVAVALVEVRRHRGVAGE